jgi:hypothetical protein
MERLPVHLMIGNQAVLKGQGGLLITHKVFGSFSTENLMNAQEDIQNPETGNRTAEKTILKHGFQGGKEKEKVILLPYLRKPPWSDQKKNAYFQTIEDINIKRKTFQHPNLKPQ